MNTDIGSSYNKINFYGYDYITDNKDLLKSMGVMIINMYDRILELEKQIRELHEKNLPNS